MLAHDVKKILDLVPEALPLIKQANLEEDFPLGSKSDCIASALRMEYLVKVANEAVDLDLYERVHKAVKLYGVGEDVYGLVEKMACSMVKEASEETSLLEKQASLESEASSSLDIEKVASEARSLYDAYGEEITSSMLLKYAGVGVLDKQAAVEGLEARYYDTGNEAFVKIASCLKDIDTDKLTREQIVKIASTVTQLDQVAHLEHLGYNFYREAIVKQASYGYTITLAGKKVPYEFLEKFGKARLAQVIGKDVADALTGNPVEDKQIIETLPLDLQRILASYA